MTKTYKRFLRLRCNCVCSGVEDGCRMSSDWVCGRAGHVRCCWWPVLGQCGDGGDVVWITGHAMDSARSARSDDPRPSAQLQHCSTTDARHPARCTASLPGFDYELSSLLFLLFVSRNACVNLSKKSALCISLWYKLCFICKSCLYVNIYL